jgi:hypothetical protein
MLSFDWKILDDRFYYYETNSGKIVGFVHKYALTSIWNSVVYVGNDRHIATNEIGLGQFVDMDFARKAIVNYWDIESRTLLE